MNELRRCFRAAPRFAGSANETMTNLTMLQVAEAKRIAEESDAKCEEIVRKLVRGGGGKPDGGGLGWKKLGSINLCLKLDWIPSRIRPTL